MQFQSRFFPFDGCEQVDQSEEFRCEIILRTFVIISLVDIYQKEEIELEIAAKCKLFVVRRQVRERKIYKHV